MVSNSGPSTAFIWGSDMCGPLAALGGQAFGVGMSTVGAFASAAMQQAALRSQARLAEINARISDASARAEVAASNRQQTMIRLKGANVKGAQRAGMAAGGIDLSSPSAQATLTSTDVITEADAITAEANGVRAAWGHRIEAGNQRRAAAGARAQAAGISPGLAAATSLISGAGQVASSWYSLSKAGAFSKGGTTGGGPSPTWGQVGHEGNHGGMVTAGGWY